MWWVQYVVDVEQYLFILGGSHMAFRDDEKRKSIFMKSISFWNFNTSNYLNINHSPLMPSENYSHKNQPHTWVMYTRVQYSTSKQFNSYARRRIPNTCSAGTVWEETWLKQFLCRWSQVWVEDHWKILLLML